MSAPNPYSPPVARVSDIHPTGDSPPIWNPRAAANWSLVFSPIFGALVQMKNWQALGEPERATTSKNWAIGSLVFFVAMTLVAAVAPDSKAVDGLTRLFGLVLLIVWYYANGKSQHAYVLARFGTTYKKRGWGVPLLWGVAGLVGFVVAMVLVGVAIGMAGGG